MKLQHQLQKQKCHEEILTEVTTKKHGMKTISESIINKIYQHQSPALTVERQYQANPTFQNIETLEFVRNTVPTVAEKISTLRTAIVDIFYPFIFNPTPKNHNHQPYPKNYLKRYYLII